MSKRPTNTAMADAMKAAATKAAKAKPAPLQILTGRQIGETRNGKPKMDIWLANGLLTALVNKYGADNVDGIQRGAEWLVEQGMVRIPTGWRIKAIAVKAFGGKVSVLAEDPATSWEPKVKAPKAVIVGLPD